MKTLARIATPFPPKALFYVIFTISGFSGLIYESIWSHYLKLFLGHAAYAQSLVLTIFMGGMAAGAWLAGRYSAAWRMPILVYAIVEAVIGVLALIFHESFIALTDVVHNTWLPATESAMLAYGLKWAVAALMIVPQSILLGMTFPLMTAGVIRRYPQDSGGSIALLYFTNSIGAAIGVLASGFWLIGVVGLPGTIATAGIINILLAVAVALIVRFDPAAATSALKSAPAAESNRSSRLMLIAAFVTGLASFVYEIGWIRMLSLVLGSSTHAFELMLSAFIMGLAFGGLWIRKRIDAIPSPIRYAGYVQIIMGLLAVLTLPLYGMTYDWMSSLLLALKRNDEGYAIFMTASHAIALAVMLPATFCAGMTLPLFTHALLKSGYGEKSIGRVYAANTLGSIVGVLFAVNIGLPYLGVKYLIGFGAALDIALGAALLYAALAPSSRRPRVAFATLAVALLVGVAIMQSSNITPSRLASGVFRYERTELPPDQEIYYYRDGKTASIAVHGNNDKLMTITTNGKPDASIAYGEHTSSNSDEYTMVLLGSLPFGFQPEARNVAIVGMGAGVTSHTALALATLERVDTIEIERSVVEAARLFGAPVARVYHDPRSHLHIEDAKTFFAVTNRKYDVIISEPSNPWVSGVASLYSKEYYLQIRNHLADRGVLAQWLHLYENDMRIVVSVLKAMDEVFGDYALYFTNSQDVLIIARKSGTLGPLQADALLKSGLRHDLARIGLKTTSDLYHRQAIRKKHLAGVLRQSDVPANSDYYPYVDLYAHRAFFIRDTVTELHTGNLDFPYIDVLNDDGRAIAKDLSENPYFFLARNYRAADAVYRALATRDAAALASLPTSTRVQVQALQAVAAHCGRPGGDQLFLLNLHDIARLIIGNIDSARAQRLWQSPMFRACAGASDPELRAWMNFYRSLAARDYPHVVDSALVLLRSNHFDESNRDTLTYLMSAAIIGSYLNGDYRTADSGWRRLVDILGLPQAAPFYLQVVGYNVTR
jgi:spermidine synthase